MQFEHYMNDLLDPDIQNFENLTNHYDLFDRLQKSFYFINLDDVDDITSNVIATLPLTEISVKLFEKALEELNCTNSVEQTETCKKSNNRFNFKYAARLSRKSLISPYCFILALIYIKRLKQINPAYIKSISNNSQAKCDLFLISLIVSSKFLDDEEIQWSQISGMSKMKLYRMEIDFLFKLNWQAYVGPREFVEEFLSIENLVINNECRKRSYRDITYNEIMRIFENDKVFQDLISNFLKFMSKFMLIALFTYSSVVVGLVMLSRSCMIQNGMIRNSQLADNNRTNWQSLHHGESIDNVLTSSSEEKQEIANESMQESIEQSIEQLNVAVSSKALNFQKLNGLNLDELNNRLNVLNDQEHSYVSVRSLSINIYTIQSNHQKCAFNKNFDQLIKTHYIYSDRRNAVAKNENHSAYLESPSSLNIREVFIQSRIY